MKRDAEQVVGGGANAEVLPQKCQAQNCDCLYPPPGSCTCLGHPHELPA